jgi:hypothetical protein
VGFGTQTITITATDAAGNISTATTTFTVKSGLTFSLSVSPETVERGKVAKLDITYANISAERMSVSFTIRSTSPCGSSVVGAIGPLLINSGAEKVANANFHVPKDACIGSYTLTVEGYVGGVFVGTTSAGLTVNNVLALKAH